MWPFNKKVKSKKRRYDGASKGRRTNGWVTGEGDANAQLAADLPTLRSRSRDLRRNNGYIKKAINTVTNNVVGRGIITQFSSDDVQKIWKEWAYSKQFDYDGRNNIFGLQRLVMDAIQESGEVLVRKRIDPNNKIPLQYQILESDFLDNTVFKKSNTNGNKVIQGIEYNSNGKRVGYHIYESHPGSIDLLKSSIKSNFIPEDEILHLFKGERPGQVRGVPWAAPIMIRVKDLDDFEDAQIMRQKVAACFTAFVQDISADVECDDGDASSQDLGEKIEPGLIEQLPSGKTITFADPPSVDNYKEFTSAQLRYVAAGWGISYESLTGDLSEVNFSSARMGWLEMGRNIDTWRDDLMIMDFLDPIVNEFINILIIMGIDTIGMTHSHISPKRDMIDPIKEIPALIKSVRAGFQSRSEAITSFGRDPDAVHDQIKKDNDKADKLELILDSDPRKVNGTGKFQEEVKDEQEDRDN